MFTNNSSTSKKINNSLSCPFLKYGTVNESTLRCVGFNYSQAGWRLCGSPSTKSKNKEHSNKKI